MNENLHKLLQLTDEQRIDARDQARQMVVKSLGKKPHRDQFQDTAISKYPAWFMKLVGGFMVIAFVASAMPSLFRLFTAGRDYFSHGIDSGWQAAIVGVSTFLLAEFLIILSTIAASTFYRGKQRLIWVFPVVMGLSMALVGNWVVTKPSDVFGWLETLIPPLSVLFIALAGERLILESIKTRHANERAFQQAMQAYNQVVNDPEQHSRWQQFHANALKESLRQAQSGGRGTKERLEIVQTLTNQEWASLVKRELMADRWFESVESAETVEIPESTVKVVERGSVDHGTVPFGNTPLDLVRADPVFTQMSGHVNGHGITAISNGKN